MVESAPRYNPEVVPGFETAWTAVEIPIASLFLLDMIFHFALLPSVPNDFCRDSRKRFFLKFETWLDIATILPTALSFAEERFPEVTQFDFLKALRVLRFTRVLRQLHSVDQLAYTLEQCAEPLLGPFLLLFGLLFSLSAAIYFAESGTYNSDAGYFEIEDCECESSSQRVMDPTFPCPKLRSKFVSIPHTMWFTLVTMTTVGYGDWRPMCPTGKVLASATALLGNILVAMPIAIVGTYYTNIVMANRARIISSSSQVKQTSRNPFGKGFGEQSKPKPVLAAVSWAEQPVAPNGAKSTTTGDGVGEERWITDLNTRFTPGQRLASILSDLDMSFDLLKPPGAVRHFINDFAKREFERIVTQLSTKEGLVAMCEAIERCRREVSFELISKPSSAINLSESVKLTRPINFRLRGAELAEWQLREAHGFMGTNPASHRVFCRDAKLLEGIPATPILIQYDPVRRTVSIASCFPARVMVNSNILEHGVYKRLLVGDTITILPNGAPFPGTGSIAPGGEPATPRSKAAQRKRKAAVVEGQHEFQSGVPPTTYVIRYQYVRSETASAVPSLAGALGFRAPDKKDEMELPPNTELPAGLSKTKGAPGQEGNPASTPSPPPNSRPKAYITLRPVTQSAIPKSSTTFSHYAKTYAEYGGNEDALHFTDL